MPTDTNKNKVQPIDVNQVPCTTDGDGSDDTRLREAKFRYSDPENTIDNLNRGKPDPTRVIEVIGYYDETPAGGKKANIETAYVWCCHCGKPTHWKGYVIRDDSGETFIIGAQNCGKHHFGVGFEDAERRFKSSRSRQKALNRWHDIADKLSVITEAVEALLRSETLVKVESKKLEILQASRECAQRLARHAISGDSLRSHRTARDHGAEERRQLRYQHALAAFRQLPAIIRKERREEGLDPKEETDPIYTSWTDDHGKVEGAFFLIEDDDLRSALLRARAAVTDIETLKNNGTASATTTKLRTQATNLSSILRDIVVKLRALNEVGKFFSSENIARMADWSEEIDRFTIKPTLGGFTLQEGHNPVAMIRGLDGIYFSEFEDFTALASSVDPPEI